MPKICFFLAVLAIGNAWGASCPNLSGSYLVGEGKYPFGSFDTIEQPDCETVLWHRQASNRKGGFDSVRTQKIVADGVTRAPIPGLNRYETWEFIGENLLHVVIGSGGGEYSEEFFLDADKDLHERYSHQDAMGEVRGGENVHLRQ